MAEAHPLKDGLTPNTSETDDSANILMQRLRRKFSQKPWSETMNLVRLCMNNPSQTTADMTSDSAIAFCLERIQRSLNAEPLSIVMNKLESIAKELGLNYYVSPSGATCYITSAVFYIEIYLEVDGRVMDVKLAHPGRSPLTCEDLLKLLRKNDFKAFGEMLEDILNIHQIPGSSERKSKVFAALLALEKDLCSLAALNRTPDMDRITEILCGKVGCVNPRTQGTPMSLEFYVSQYQILEQEINPDLEMHGWKVFVTVGEADAIHTLPLTPLVEDSLSCADSKPTFLPLEKVTCASLSACYYLTFDESQPFCLSSSRIHELQKITGVPIDGLQTASLHELIVQSTLSKMQLADLITSNSGFILSLPDCPKHQYFIDRGMEDPDLAGAMVEKIPFAHPECVPLMLEVLRHQAAYNTLVSSCVSEKTQCEDSSDLLHFEVSPQNVTSFSVTFQHPLEENLACVKIDVLSSREVRCILHTVSEDGSFHCSNDYLTRVVNRCMSVPVLMRAIFKKAKQKADV